MAASPSDLLTQTETAITACLLSQSYTVAGRQKSMAQLATLREFRQELLNEIAVASSGGGSMCSLLQLEHAT